MLFVQGNVAKLNNEGEERPGVGAKTLLTAETLSDWGNEIRSRNKITRLLRGILAPDWSVRARPLPRARDFDFTLEVVAPNGTPSIFEVEVKARLEPRDIDQLERLAAKADHRLVVVAPYCSPRSRALLREQNISYIDSTGNAWLSGDSLLVERRGADKALRREADVAPRTSLRGPITGRVVRYLCDTRPPMKVRQIAMETDAHPGNVSRILGFLDRERLVRRTPTGAVSSVDWKALIERWSGDLQKDRRAESFLEPHGLNIVTKSVSESDLPYALTGSFAAAQLAPVVVPAAVDIYVRDIEEARAALSLRRSERIGNVRLIEAFDRVAFERSITTERNLRLACPTQIAADLLTLATRSLDEYSEFVAWMERHESVWRR